MNGEPYPDDPDHPLRPLDAAYPTRTPQYVWVGDGAGGGRFVESPRRGDVSLGLREMGKIVQSSRFSSLLPLFPPDRQAPLIEIEGLSEFAGRLRYVGQIAQAAGLMPSIAGSAS